MNKLDLRSEELRRGPIPAHVAIIMDGNGRWAKRRLLPRSEGHRAGARSVRRTLKAAISLGVSWLTLYTFSLENWDRPTSEVNDLMRMLDSHLRSEEPSLIEQGVGLRAVGELERLPPAVLATLRHLEARTAQGAKITLVLALSYGSRQEIQRAAEIAGQAVLDGRRSAAGVDADYFSSLLLTAGIPPVDLLIRTSGERRLSNFLLWQSAGALLHFTRTLWPDFDRAAFYHAVEDYQRETARHHREAVGYSAA